MNPVRCPYCVEGNEFKTMPPYGNRLICLTCFHTELLNEPWFICNCSKCKELGARRVSNCCNFHTLSPLMLQLVTLSPLPTPKCLNSQHYCLCKFAKLRAW